MFEFEFEAFGAIRDFVETGGNVMLVIAAVTFWMWWLILERFWYFRWIHPKEAEAVEQSWNARADQRSWNAHQIRELMISEVELKLQRGVLIIKSLVALCPMLGLIGTVTGMIEVFDVMAIAGTGNIRGMAGGVSKATLPTMAGMVAAISGLMFSAQIERFVKAEVERVADQLELAQE
jgi:biopolymer transport protein ExbB